VYLPGDLCAHPEGEFHQSSRRQLRISYGYANLEQLRRGVALLGEAMQYARRSG
jgi:DNA-binding transcriptional MocR family regulator